MKDLFYNLLIPFSNRVAAFSSSKLRVLAYHTIDDPYLFEKQLKYLKSSYKVIGIFELEQFLFDGADLPKNAVLITFDDGDLSVLDFGLPLLKKYNMPSVMFVITGLIDSKKTFWCRWVELAIQNQGKSYAEARVVVNRLKKMDNEERVAYLNKLEPIVSKQLTRNDILKMHSEKMFVGNHTHTHPMVDKCTSEELQGELKTSKDSFKNWGLPGYQIFAYPNGNWDAKSEKILIDNEIKMAFLFDHQLNKKDVNPMRISRIRVNSDTKLHEFKVKVSGLHSKLMKFKENIT
ncbi:polysaccharide deacetylase family protein [Gillisia sp. M10.2A]|uniref:Polysaccharide deacetylase family protein n=1 Tax=Gillisia lutea TaxID=2909668 RepID=A0ABS9EIG9_9FLAO|nr:polysaccharide deacetylase family protein [Gillisia lutea]MCF4102657.1 polysaccharide deacetylase family protein [Gillisia lutea]